LGGKEHYQRAPLQTKEWTKKGNLEAGANWFDVEIFVGGGKRGGEGGSTRVGGKGAKRKRKISGAPADLGGGATDVRGMIRSLYVRE